MTRIPDMKPPAPGNDKWLSGLLLAFCLLFSVLVIAAPAHVPDLDDATLEQMHSASSMEATDHSGDDAVLPLMSLNSPTRPHHSSAHPPFLVPRMSAEFIPGSRPPNLS